MNFDLMDKVLIALYVAIALAGIALVASMATSCSLITVKSTPATTTQECPAPLPSLKFKQAYPTTLNCPEDYVCFTKDQFANLKAAIAALEQGRVIEKEN